MRKTKWGLWAVMAVTLSSCMMVTSPTEPAVPDGHHFSYVISGREPLHLIQAFDDGSKTYLEFDDTPSAPLEIRDPKDGEGVTYTVDQRYVIVPGVHGVLAVTVAGTSATVVNQARVPDPPPAREASVPALSDTHPHDARTADMTTDMTSEKSGHARSARLPTVAIAESRTISRESRAPALNPKSSMLEENVRRLGEQLDAAHAAGFGDGLSLRAMGGISRVVVKFADQSAEVHIDDRLLGVLGDAARSATQIHLHGSTDSFVASPTSTALALRRAVEVKRLLIALDVEPQRIRLFYRGAGNFIGNNSTADGKALNRRVEMEFRPW